MAKITTPFWAFSGPLRTLLVIVLGASAGLGQAPSDWWPITPICFGIAMALYADAPTRPKAARLIWSLGIGYFAVSLRWIIEPFLVDADRYGWMAPFALFAMAAGAGLFWALAAMLATRIRTGNLWVLALTLTLAEALRSLILTGFPWALAGHIWIDTPLAQLSAFAGPHLLSLLTFALAAALASLNKTTLILPLITAAIWPVLAVGPMPPPTDAPLVRIIHPNVPQAEKWDPAFQDINFQRMLSFMDGGVRPDLIVWPETAVAQLLEFAGPSLDLIADAAQGVPLITGIQRRREGQIFHNSLIVLGRGARIDGIYDKRHLVPFGEYFPGGELATRFGLYGFASSQGAGFTAGTTPKTLDIPGIGLIRPLICYEAIFPEEVTSAQRPKMMIQITNDAWFGTGAGPYQHLAQARLRAIEQGLPMIRAANQGVSAVIDAKGRITAQMPLDTEGALDALVPAALPATLYSRLGDLPVLMLCLAGLVLSVRRGNKSS